MKKTSHSEKNIQRKILQYLKTISFCHCFKVAQGLYSTSGISDILCCCRGRFVAIEVKTLKGRVTKLQELFLQQIKKLGGVGIVARSLEDVKKMIKEEFDE